MYCCITIVPQTERRKATCIDYFTPPGIGVWAWLSLGSPCLGFSKAATDSLSRVGFSSGGLALEGSTYPPTHMFADSIQVLVMQDLELPGLAGCWPESAPSSQSLLPVPCHMGSSTWLLPSSQPARKTEPARAELHISVT